MFDDVISTGLQAVLAEIFESVDKRQLNVSLVGDIFKESHLELTDLRLKKTLLKDLNLPVEVKEGLVGKLVIQGLSGVMTGDPVSITISEVLVLLAPGGGLSDAEAGLAARRLMATLREMFGNRYSEDFMEDALRVKVEDRMSVQQQNKLNRKVLRHICRKLLASISITLQTVHVRFELPAGGPGSDNPVKKSAGVGGGGACDAVGVMLPSLTMRACGADHPAFAKFAAATPLDRLASNTAAAARAGAIGASSAMPSTRAGGDDAEKKNFSVVRKRVTVSNLQVYCDYGVDSYASDISAAVAAARNGATNPRPGPGGAAAAAQAAAQANAAGVNRGAAAAARAVRTVFVQKWRSERHALLFTPLAMELGAEVQQWDQPGGKSVTPVYRLVRLNVGVGDLQTVIDSEQGRVLGTVLRDVINLVRRSRYNRFVPQAFLPLRNLPPPKVRPPKPPKDGAPGGMLPSVECWSWSAELGEHGANAPSRKPLSAAEAVVRGGYKKEDGTWARAMWRFAGACVRRDLRASLTRQLPATLPNWNGTIPPPPSSSSLTNGTGEGVGGRGGSVDPLSWRVTYLRLHTRTLIAREAKSISTLGGGKTPDVRRLGVPRGREPLSLEEMWELARVESFAPGDEVVFLRTAAKLSSHFEWMHARRARAAAKAAASSGAAEAAANAAMWTMQDDANVLAELDELRMQRAAAAIAKKEGKGVPGEESEEEEEEEVTRLEFFARDGQSLTDAASANPFSDDEDESGSEDDSEDEDDEDFDPPGGEVGVGMANGGGGGGRAGGGQRSLGEIAAMAKAGAGAQSSAPPSAVVVRTGGGGKKKGGVGSEVWSRLLTIPRVVFEVTSVGLELRTCISGGARRPLVSLSAAGLSGTMEGDENRRVLWWELRVGQVTLRDLCSSWGSDGAKAGAAAPVARTLLSGSASGVDGREWAFAGDVGGVAARSFVVLRVVHDPNRLACGLFPGSAAALAELRAHVVLGCVTGKIPPQVLAVFNAAARDILISEKNTAATGKTVPVPSSTAAGTNSAKQLRVALTAIHAAVSEPTSISFKPKKRKGPSGAVRALSLARGAVARGGGSSTIVRSATAGSKSDSPAGEVDSKELYRVVAGLLPADLEIRLHSSEVIVQVESRAEDLLEAGRVAFEALGEGEAAAGLQGNGAAASEGINLEVHVAPAKMDACRSSHPSPELWVDTGLMRAKLRAPEKAVEAVVTALLSSAQKTKAAVALLSSATDEEIA